MSTPKFTPAESRWYASEAWGMSNRAMLLAGENRRVS